VFDGEQKYVVKGLRVWMNSSCPERYPVEASREDGKGHSVHIKGHIAETSQEEYKAMLLVTFLLVKGLLGKLA
jgi:hypothetical protein